MAYIHLKIEKDNQMVKYIKIIREYDKSLSMNDIKEKIEKDDFVLGYNSNEYDISDTLNGVDRKRVFRKLIQDLEKIGANITIYKNNEIISLDFLDNWLNCLDEIEQDIEEDMDRESED